MFGFIILFIIINLIITKKGIISNLKYKTVLKESCPQKDSFTDINAFKDSVISSEGVTGTISYLNKELKLKLVVSLDDAPENSVKNVRAENEMTLDFQTYDCTLQGGSLTRKEMKCYPLLFKMTPGIIGPIECERTKPTDPPKPKTCTSDNCNGDYECNLETDKCEEKNDCNGEKCIFPLKCDNGECKIKCNGIFCTDNEVCENNVCLKQCDSLPCPTGTYCHADNICRTDECIITNDCKDEKECDNKVCKVRCNGILCDTNQVCISNTCENQCDSTTCIDPYHCNDNTNVCEEIVVCGDGEIHCEKPDKCDNKVCRRKCTNKVDCLNNEYCHSDGFCRKEECIITKDCPAGQECDNKVCKTPCGGSGNYCNENQVCISNTCKDRCVDGSSNCPSGYECIVASNVCQESSVCNGGIYCVYPQKCDNSNCQPTCKSDGSGCLNDKHCHIDNICRDEECITTDDCRDITKVCIDNVCEVACSDTDCTDPYECKPDNKCQTKTQCGTEPKLYCTKPQLCETDSCITKPPKELKTELHEDEVKCDEQYSLFFTKDADKYYIEFLGECLSFVPVIDSVGSYNIIGFLILFILILI